jgi:PE family protein
MYVDLESDNQRKGPNATLNVDPEKLTQIQQGFEAEVERIRTWIREHSDPLINVTSPGEDDCSQHMMNDLVKSGTSALDAARTYAQRLETAALKLADSVKAYQASDDANAANLRQVTE